MYRSKLILPLVVLMAHAVFAFSFPEFFGRRIERTSWVPKETAHVAQLNRAKAPQPTSPPMPDFAEMELLKRYPGYTMGTDTCGFVASYQDDPFTCVRIGATCTNDGTYIGCCTTTGLGCSSILKTACVPYSSSLAGACASLSGSNTLCCSSDYPLCHSYTFETTASPGLTLTLVDCDTKTGVGLLIDYPPSITKSTSSTRRTTSTSTTSSSSTSSNPDAIVTVTSSTTTSAASSSGSSSAPAGAIAGGVVGGVAVIGLIVLGVFFLLRKSRNKTDQNAPQPSPMQALPEKFAGAGAGAFAPQSPSSPGSSFNPSSHYSYPAGAVAPFPQSLQPGQGQQPGYNSVHSPHTSMYGYPTSTGSPPPISTQPTPPAAYGITPPAEGTHADTQGNYNNPNPHAQQPPYSMQQPTQAYEYPYR